MKRSRSPRAVRSSAAVKLVVVLMVLSACETNAETNERAATAKQLVGERHGDGVTQESSVSIAEILSNPEDYEGRAVRVEGTVTDVCPMRGCWFELAGDAPGEEIVFKVNDGEMVFPVTAIGKHAVAEGVVRVKELTLEETRRFAGHLAEEKGEAFDATTITEPRTLVQLAGTGAVILEGP